MSTRFPIKDDVMQFCKRCSAIVWCARTVYPDETYFTCRPHRHHFTMSELTRARELLALKKAWRLEHQVELHFARQLRGNHLQIEYFVRKLEDDAIFIVFLEKRIEELE